MKAVSNVSALQLFHVMRFGTLILIGILLVKSGYSPEEISIYELFFFLANVVSFFWVMGLNNALISYYPSLSELKKKSILFNLAVILLLAGILAGGGLLLFETSIARMLDKEALPYLGWIVLYMLLSAPGNFTEYVYLLRNQTRSIVQYGVILYAAQLVLISIGIFNGYEVVSLLKLMVMWAGLKFIWFWVVVLKQGIVKIDLRMQWIFLGFAAPLIGHMLLGNGMEYVDGFLVNYFFEDGMFAKFRYGARELPLVSVLVGSISTALIPQAVSSMDQALAEVKRKVHRLSMFLFPISTVLMLLSSLLFEIFYSEEYLISAQIFNVYLLVIISRILMPQVIVFAKHKNMVLLASAFVELILNIILSLWLLKIFGILGIAWATVIAYLVNKLILMIYSYLKFGISPRAYLKVGSYGLWVALLIVTYIISLYLSA